MKSKPRTLVTPPSHPRYRHVSTEKALKEWLVETGYPLEMEVANVLRNRGFAVFQSDYYKDPQSDEYREIDVVAVAAHAIGKNGNLLHVRVLCECKTSRTKPWLFFVDDANTPNERLLLFSRAGNRFAHRLLSRAIHDLCRTHPPLFAFDRPPAYGVTQAFRKKPSDPDVSYLALMQAANAVRVRTLEADEVTPVGPYGAADAEVFIPVVVVDGELFDVSLGQDWAPNLTPVERQVVLWRNPIAGRFFTIIHVVRKDRVGAFTSDLKSGIEAAFKWCDTNENAALKAFSLHTKQPQQSGRN